MGAICSISSLACCCSSSACSLCCSACPSVGSSTTTRIGYGLLLIGATVIAMILLSDFASENLSKLDFVCNQITSQDCKAFIGYFSAYRILFSVAIFFAFMSLLMIKVKNSEDKRAGFQKGFWLVKIAMIVALVVIAFFVPSGYADNVMMYVGLVGGFLFIVLQLVLLIDFAYQWNENWVERMEDYGRKWFYALLSVTILLYIASLIATILIFVFYAGSGCGLQKFIIIFNFVLCIVISIVSILPAIQEQNPSSGLLQSAVMTGYVVFLLWSTCTSSPHKQCNPSFSEIFTNKGSDSSDESSMDAVSIVSIIIWTLCVLYSSVSSASRSPLGAPSLSDHVLMGGGETDGDKKSQTVYDDETEQVAYSYSFFHLTMMLASLYIMMCITNWLNPFGSSNGLHSFQRSSSAMWAKILSSWLCLCLYFWSLIAPLVLTNREF